MGFFTQHAVSLRFFPCPLPPPLYYSRRPPDPALSQINYLNLKKKKKKIWVLCAYKGLCAFTFTHSYIKQIYIEWFQHKRYYTGTWVAQSIKHLLQLRSWSQVPGIRPCIGLPTQRGICLSLLLCLCPSSSLCTLPLSNKKIFKKEILY